MLERREREDHLFVAGSLRDLIPEDHVLRQVDRVLDLSWLRAEVSEFYDLTNGRPGIDPEAAVRLMLAGFFAGIREDRKLMREAQVNLAMRWFAGYRLDEKLPDHSSLTRIRQRWGVERFLRIFERTVLACSAHGLVSGETVHVDATLIRANASMESLTRAHAEAVWRENAGDDDPGPSGGKPREGTYSKTDPDATLTRSSRSQNSQPRYKQHTAVDDKAQIIVDVQVTTGIEPEEHRLLHQLATIERRLNTQIQTVTADKRYGIAANYAALEELNIDAVISPQIPPPQSEVPLSAFKFDERHDLLRCPRSKQLTPRGRDEQNRTIYRSRKSDCRGCDLAAKCLSAGSMRLGIRTVKVMDGYTALLRARRRHLRREALDRIRTGRHRWQVEGVHGEAKAQHGLDRAARRGIKNVAIQVYLTAATMNLKRLAQSVRIAGEGTLQPNVFDCALAPLAA